MGSSSLDLTHDTTRSPNRQPTNNQAPSSPAAAAAATAAMLSFSSELGCFHATIVKKEHELHEARARLERTKEEIAKGQVRESA